MLSARQAAPVAGRWTRRLLARRQPVGSKLRFPGARLRGGRYALRGPCLHDAEQPCGHAGYLLGAGGSRQGAPDEACRAGRPWGEGSQCRLEQRLRQAVVETLAQGAARGAEQQGDKDAFARRKLGTEEEREPPRRLASRPGREPAGPRGACRGEERAQRAGLGERLGRKRPALDGVTREDPPDRVEQAARGRDGWRARVAIGRRGLAVPRDGRRRSAPRAVRVRSALDVPRRLRAADGISGPVSRWPLAWVERGRDGFEIDGPTVEDLREHSVKQRGGLAGLPRGRRSGRQQRRWRRAGAFAGGEETLEQRQQRVRCRRPQRRGDGHRIIAPGPAKRPRLHRGDRSFRQAARGPRAAFRAIRGASSRRPGLPLAGRAATFGMPVAAFRRRVVRPEPRAAPAPGITVEPPQRPRRGCRFSFGPRRRGGGGREPAGRVGGVPPPGAACRDGAAAGARPADPVPRPARGSPRDRSPNPTGCRR
jgi:hypothetical protein